MELQWHMQQQSIDIICLQETHREDSDVQITDAGFLLILSGQAETEVAETAGVGFLLSPHVRRNLVGFQQPSARMARIKLRVPGGKWVLCNIYAPHNGKDFAVRHAFFQNVATWLTQQSRHGPLYVVGDFNARIHKIFDEEADSRCLGPYVFGKTSAHVDGQSNRSLLLELCHAHDLAVANTFMEQPACRQVTVYNVGSSPVDELTAAHFGQIDFVLVQRAWLGTVRQLYSDMNMALASHHFAVIADLQIAVPKVVKEVIPKHALNSRVSISALNAVEVANRFALLFDESMSNHEHHELSVDDFYDVMSDAFRHAADKCLPQRARIAKRPWISSETLSLLQRRDDARFSRDVSAERDLSKQIRRSVAVD